MPKTKYRKRPDGRYEFKVTTDEYTPSGKPRRKTVYGRTVAELERNIEDAKEELRAGGNGLKDNTTVEAWYEIWINTYKKGAVRETTLLETYARNSKYILNAIGKMRMRDVRQVHLQKILTDLNDQGLSASLIRKVRMCAVQMFSAAVDNQTIIHNPAKKLTTEGRAEQPRGSLSAVQQQVIMHHYELTPFGVAVITMMLCGLRRGEVVALEKKDIDLTEGVMHIDRAASFPVNTAVIGETKTDNGKRTIPIPDILVPILSTHLAKVKGNIAFPKASGGYHSVSSFRVQWKTFIHACERETNVSFDGITPHWLRHTYATLLYDAGVDLLSAKEWLGHANVLTTLKIYTHLSNARKVTSEDRVRSIDPLSSNSFSEPFVVNLSSNGNFYAAQ